MALAQATSRPQQMYLAQQSGRGGPSGLADVLEVLLDKGLVIDAFVRVSLVGIELLTIDARVVVASVDTYLRFAEAVNRLDLLQVNNSKNLGDLVGGSSNKSTPRESSDSNDARALSSDSGRDQRAESGDSQPEKEKNEDRSTDEANDASDGSPDDKGILTRIKERGQVF